MINISESEDVFLSDRAQFSLNGSGYFRVGDEGISGDIWFDALRDDSKSDTLIPLHDACIDISCRAIESRQNKSSSAKWKPALSVLNLLLQHRFRLKARSTFETRNDLLNLCKLHDHYGARSVLALSKVEWWGGVYEVERINSHLVQN